MKICASHTHTHQRTFTTEEALNNSADETICPVVLSQSVTINLGRYDWHLSKVTMEVEMELIHGLQNLTFQKQILMLISLLTHFLKDYRNRQ